jgi:hypothetical protein
MTEPIVEKLKVGALGFLSSAFMDLVPGTIYEVYQQMPMGDEKYVLTCSFEAEYVPEKDRVFTPAEAVPIPKSSRREVNPVSDRRAYR